MGLSGAPFVTRDGYVAGMRTESFNEATIVIIPQGMPDSDAIEMLSDTTVRTVIFMSTDLSVMH